MSQVDFTDPATIAELTAALEAAGVDGLEIERPTQGVRILLARGRSPIVDRTAEDRSAVVPASFVAVKAPMAGEFLSHDISRSAAPEDHPQEVESGDVIGFVKVGPILLPLAAPASGQIVRHVAEHGAIVGFGDPLFEIEPRS
ncbi:hypothetical protein [Ensifer sp. LC163]|uniref:hypothetical protein n=1 Tax=Ensifer sp. LC163 TaxID=1120652 RepID=UPI000812C23A|nr:hypothetical protein [Ensifer sp. LC163]OCP35792.1 hypothetical protein BC360_27295 [Ensifer sp. LC163]